jgi:N6-adenosine-specific RNA methylase IME4
MTWGPYELIIVDPPWPETGGGGRGTDHHYETVQYDEIPALVLGAPCWRPARAFWFGCWTTANSYAHAVDLMRAAGVRHVTKWPWIKRTAQGTLHFGTGQYGSQGTVEDLLWGKRGTIGRAPGDYWQKAMAATETVVGAHSEKPDEIYEKARKIFDHTRALEMFARKPREGFDGWGRVDGQEFVRKVKRRAG